MANTRRRQNYIGKVIVDGVLVEEEDIKVIVVNFYKALFEGEVTRRPSLDGMESATITEIEFELVRMGRKAGGLYINSKKLGSLHKPCMKEMISFLNCLALNQNSDDKCVRQKSILSTCMDAQDGKNRGSCGSINYHLQRLNRGRK